MLHYITISVCTAVCLVLNIYFPFDTIQLIHFTHFATAPSLWVSIIILFPVSSVCLFALVLYYFVCIYVSQVSKTKWHFSFFVGFILLRITSSESIDVVTNSMEYYSVIKKIQVYLEKDSKDTGSYHEVY